MPNTQSATKAIAVNVIKESNENGKIDSYYKDNAKFEGDMRNNFTNLNKLIRNNEFPTIFLKTAEDCFRELSGKYRTRYPLKHMTTVTELFISNIRAWAFDFPNPPNIMDCSDDVALACSNIIIHMLNSPIFTTPNGEHGNPPRPYSLLTKFLHFNFPDSFPIYDSQVALSIQMWSYMTFKNRDITWEKYSYPNIVDKSGNGYPAIISFYRIFWQEATKEQRLQLDNNAKRLSEVTQGHVSVLDLIDKSLWIANGDPLHLGLFQPSDIRLNE